MKSRKNEVDGNAMESARRYTAQMSGLGELLWRTERILESLDGEDCWVLDMRFRSPAGEGSSWQVVVRALLQGEKVVGFGDGETFADAVRVTLARLENKTMKWKADKYAQGN